MSDFFIFLFLRLVRGRHLDEHFGGINVLSLLIAVRFMMHLEILSFSIISFILHLNSRL
jgi:hypothetical protein